MGADLIIAATTLRTGRKPDWDAAERFIATLTLDQIDDDFTGTYDDMEDDEEMRAFLRSALAAFKEIIEGDCPRDFTWIDGFGHTIYVSGGMSWGDSPGDTFDLICDLTGAGVLKAAGFDQPTPYADIESIARQVLGHCFPDRSFDELSPDDIARVADNLGSADEVLAQVLPLIVEE